jgi:hypothetical protein
MLLSGVDLDLERKMAEPGDLCGTGYQGGSVLE